MNLGNALRGVNPLNNISFSTRYNVVLQSKIKRGS